MLDKLAVEHYGEVLPDASSLPDARRLCFLLALGYVPSSAAGRPSGPASRSRK